MSKNLRIAENRLKRAVKKYTKGTIFLSASGSGYIGKVTGSLSLKWVNVTEKSSDEVIEDSKQNGDIVVSGGVGCIYNAKENTWAEIIK